MNIQTSRKISAFIGAIVGDAACLQLDWIYDQSKVANIVKDKDPEFWPESHCPFFTLPNGKVSCYADEAVQSLNVMAANDGKFDSQKLIQHFVHYFGDPESPYQVAKAKRVDKKYPIAGPWIQGTVIKMMDRYKDGFWPPGPEKANEHDGLTTALALIIQQAPDIDMKQLKVCFNLMTTCPDSIKHHETEAFLIHEFIKGAENPIEATKEQFKKDENIIKEINAVLDGKKSGKSAQELVKTFGMACPMPGSFQSSLVSIIDAKSYAAAIRESILCGGDCCSRSNLIGACLGAKFGIQGIPMEWMSKVDGIEDILENCIKVLA